MSLEITSKTDRKTRKKNWSLRIQKYRHGNILLVSRRLSLRSFRELKKSQEAWLFLVSQCWQTLLTKVLNAKIILENNFLSTIILHPSNPAVVKSSKMEVIFPMVLLCFSLAAGNVLISPSALVSAEQHWSHQCCLSNTPHSLVGWGQDS